MVLDDDGEVSTNHNGWEIQILTKNGWKSYGGIRSTDKYKLIQHVIELTAMFAPVCEFRVYEMLGEKS